MIKTYNNDNVIENFATASLLRNPKKIMTKLPKRKNFAKVGGATAAVTGTTYAIGNTINNCQISGGCNTAFRANTVRLDKDITNVKNEVKEKTKDVSIHTSKIGVNMAKDVILDSCPLCPLYIAIGIIIFIIFIMYFYF